jgi:HK97 family phage major capsid protein
MAHESVITLLNGSEIWIGGLGDREQADKILGHEYNTIYFNEVSQLSYAAVTTAYSRLAMRTSGCKNLFLYDCNPGSPLHWAYKVFIRKQQSFSGEPLAKLGFSPNFGVENWTNPKSVRWETGKGWTVTKGDPMGDMTTNDQYLVHPAYEREIIEIAEKKSVMMPLVDTTLMTTQSRIITVEKPGGITLEWLTAYGEEIHDTKPQGFERLELKAYTCAGFIPFYDEFEDDAFIDLGKYFLKKFSAAYAQEFDRQCLTANAAPFTGALVSSRAVSVPIAGNTINDLTWEDFNKAALKIPAEERKDCRWFLHETVVNHVMNIKDANGNPILRHPLEKMPGVIDLYPYHECHVMPQFSGLGADKPFAVFMNPQRIIHGNRKGIELKRFDGTTESLKFGTVALRFRKRDGFIVAAPEGHFVVLKTKP